MSRDTTTGLKFEKTTDLFTFLLSEDYEEIETDIYKKEDNLFYNLKGNKLYRFLLKHGIDYKKIISRKLLPDECVYSENSKTLYVFEKKFQQTTGSADEKLQTCDFKKKQYQKLTQSLELNVKYIYVLSDWFKQDMYSDVLDYILSMDCDYRFVDDFYSYDLI